MSTIITLEGYKDYVGIKSTQTDTQLQAIIDYASSLVEAYCNTSFSSASVVDRRITVLPDERQFIVPNAPLLSISEIKVVQDDLVVDLAQCYIESDIGAVTLPKGIAIPDDLNNISLSYTYGYTTPPAAVVLACYELVTHIHKREFMKSKSVDGQNANFQDPKVLPTHIRTSLDLFKVL